MNIPVYAVVAKGLGPRKAYWLPEKPLEGEFIKAGVDEVYVLAVFACRKEALLWKRINYPKGSGTWVKSIPARLILPPKFL